MPIYIYKAKNGPSEVAVGEIEAESQDSAAGKLMEMGLFPVSVAEKSADERVNGARLAVSGYKLATAENRKPKTETTAFIKVKARDLDTFTHQLASLVKASVPMLKALALIAEQTEARPFKAVVNNLEKQVKEGHMLSEAMALYPDIFDSLYLSVVRSGERGGALDEVLRALALHRERAQELRQKIQAAMAYPALLIMVGLGTVFVMLTYFLPKLMKLFVTMKQELPLPTKILMCLSRFMSANWLFLLIAAVFLIVIFGRMKPGLRQKIFLDIFKLKVPLINKFLINSETARFSRTFSLLIKNGIPVTESLELAADTLNNEFLKERLRSSGREIVNQGSTLAGSIKKAGIFPAFAVNMIAVGEEGGRLEESLTEVANVYEKDVEQTIKIATTLIEPVLILAIGAVVGFIVLAMLLPIFNMGTIVK
ncbi:MAG: type II secretion system F family protein [Candidatus Omnitrophota bacterium]